MCLELWVEVDASQGLQLEAAARKVSGQTIQVAIPHSSPWPWARQRPARAYLSDGRGCACGLLADDADWDAEAWSMRPDILEPLARTVEVLLNEGLGVVNAGTQNPVSFGKCGFDSHLRHQTSPSTLKVPTAAARVIRLCYYARLFSGGLQ